MTVAAEMSRSWAQLQAGSIPKDIDLFFILWVDRTSETIRSYSVCLSTSEPSPHGPSCDALVVTRTSVMVSPATPKAFAQACAHGVQELEQDFFWSGKAEYRELLAKYKADMQAAKKPSAPLASSDLVKVVSDEEFQRLLQRQRSIKG